jgi:small-conductance mechanosensitive channel
MPEESEKETAVSQETAEKTPETSEEETLEEPTGGGIGALFSPEGVVLMTIAVILDLVGIILILFALDDFFITDIIGIIFISAWMLIRSSTVAVPKKMQKKAQTGLAKLFRGPWKKFLTPIIGEVIPYAGALPCWTLAVYYEITS